MYVWDPTTGELVERIVDSPLARAEDSVRYVVEKNRYNCPPASHLPVIRANHDGHSEMIVARWGFPIPQRRNGVFNARIESVTTSTLWAPLWGADHAVFIVKGFYEWKGEGKRKVPHFIQRADGQPMVLGCLAGDRTIDGAPRPCFSVVTTGAVGLMAGLHDRMPLVLDSENARPWLHPRDTGVAALEEMVATSGDIALKAHRVGPDVGSTQNDHPGLMEPVPQTGLGAFGGT